MNAPLISEVRSINRMLHGYTSQILENGASASRCIRINPEVAMLLSTLPAERVDIFDVPLCTAIENNNPDFWDEIVSKQEITDCDQQKKNVNINWRQKAINRTGLLFARDLARENTKLCQCMLGVNKNVADSLSKLTISRATDVAQEYEQPLFTIREDNNLAFWRKVAACNNDDRKMAKILNNWIKMRCFTQLYPVESDMAVGWVM